MQNSTMERTPAPFLSRHSETPREYVITNARIVLDGECIKGHLRIVDEKIADISSGGTGLRSGLDLDDDFLLPGLIDVHTDHLEKQIMPRPGMRWNQISAAMTYDAVLCAAGITTVFDSLIVGAIGNPERRSLLPLMIEGLAEAERLGGLRASHFLHLRCDAREPDLIDLVGAYKDHPRLRFMTIMDDSPGRDEARFRRIEKRRGVSDELIDQMIASFDTVGDCTVSNRQRLVELAQGVNVPLASHDDTKASHIAEARSYGLSISEFPITLEAAKAARAEGMTIIVGAPNLVAGRSHIGNVSARELASEGLIDVVCSDYVPGGLLQGLWRLSHPSTGLTLADAISRGSKAPAALFGFADRGTIEVGKRADLCRVREHASVPMVRNVWVAGTKVF